MNAVAVKPAAPKGLVTCAITVRPDHVETRKSVDSWSPHFPSPDLVGLAAAEFARRTRRSSGHSPAQFGAAGAAPVQFGVPSVGAGQNGKAALRAPYMIQVTPGTVSLAYSRGDAADKSAFQRQGYQFVDYLGEQLTKDDSPCVVEPTVPFDVEYDDELPDARVVSGWSSKSRARLRRRLAELDYNPLVEACAGRAPVMVTLTYPGEWESVAGSFSDVKRHLTLLVKRWARRWGSRPPLIWKLEFQRRGAPHFHLLVPLPVDRSEFTEWLSATWASVVGHKDPEQYRRHLLAGTGVDAVRGGGNEYAGSTMTDPRRLATYFLKHASGGSKEYQHVVPAVWLSNGGTGRYWGYQGLKVAHAQIALSYDEYMFIRRTLRRMNRAKGLTQTVRVSRGSYVEETIDSETGEIVETVKLKFRTVTRRSRSLGGTGAAAPHGCWMAFQDAPAVLLTLSRFLNGASEDSPSVQLWRDLISDYRRGV